ncbi:hypothetical protein [Paenibacillus sp. MBLB4367]|uniref:hypothetical protein n=1 Tax=Paenibacillus sp. MBLB4367 TaxID=3384767 RepID=UPI003907E792
MDCLICHGNGELDNNRSGEEQDRMEGTDKGTARDGYWPYTCPVCGGSGYLDDSR